MINKEIEEDKQHLRNLSEDALKCEDNTLIGIDAYAVGSITRILQYIDQLENKVKELGKGQHTLMQSRRKWKNRYYKEKRKNVNTTNKEKVV